MFWKQHKGRPRLKFGMRDGDKPQWWMDETREYRRICNDKRKRLTSGRRNGAEYAAVKEEYNEVRKEYGRAMRRSKRERLREVCRELSNDIWGRGYKILMNNIKRMATPYDSDTIRRKR